MIVAHFKTVLPPRPGFAAAATVKDRFRAWKETYQQDYTTHGLFEPDIAPYTIGKTKYSVRDLNPVDGSEVQGYTTSSPPFSAGTTSPATKTPSTN